MQPGAAIGVHTQRFVRCLGLIEIAHHDRRPGDADFAFFAGRKFFAGADPTDAGQHVRQRQANRSFAILIHRGGHDATHRLGEAVAFQQLHVATAGPHQCFEALLHRAWQGIGTGKRGAQAR